MTVPVSDWVCALNALQNSMMLIPCWPSAGPTGGAGLACPAFACSLMVVRTFLAMGVCEVSLAWEFERARRVRAARGSRGARTREGRRAPRTRLRAGHGG